MKKALRVEDLRLEGLVWSSLWGFIAFGSLGFTKGMPRLQDHGLPHSEGSFVLTIALRTLGVSSKCADVLYPCLDDVGPFSDLHKKALLFLQRQLEPGAERP